MATGQMVCELRRVRKTDNVTRGSTMLNNGPIYGPCLVANLQSHLHFGHVSPARAIDFLPATVLESRPINGN